MRTACAAFLVFLIFAGIAGEQNPFRNIVVVSVWIIGWVGISTGLCRLRVIFVDRDAAGPCGMSALPRNPTFSEHQITRWPTTRITPRHGIRVVR